MLSSDNSYNKNVYLRESHNCYNYFLNKKSINAIKTCKNIDYKREGSCRRPQPGYAAGMKPMTNKDYTCKTINYRTLKDNPLILKATEQDTCKKGYYKGALVVAPNRDFHYYRLNDDGVWSHKPGGSKSAIVDSNNKPIINPRLAGRKYGKHGSLNYKDFCSYYCLPKDGHKKHMKMYKDIAFKNHQATPYNNIALPKQKKQQTNKKQPKKQPKKQSTRKNNLP